MFHLLFREETAQWCYTGENLYYTKSCDYATRKTEIVQYLGSRLRRGTNLNAVTVLHLGSRLRWELALQGNKLQAVDI